jgi:DNA-binding beta-propeller fold protein YncE
MHDFLARPLAMLALAVTVGFNCLGQTTNGFHVVRTLVLGGEGSWDYLRFDPSLNRLFVTRSTRVMVVDLTTGTVSKEIPNTAGVHGVALVPDLRRGVTSNGKANTASIFDLDSLELIATVPTGEKPDAILWEPFTKTVLTMNGHSNSITIIDVQGGKPLDTINLPGRPETAVADAHGQVFVNLEDKAQIAQIDMTTRMVKHTWDLAGCTEPTGLAIDPVHSRLFSGCHNGVLVAVNAISGETIQKLPIGQGVDAVTFDPAIRTVFTSNGEGTISVIEQVTPDSYRNLEIVQTIQGAKTMALDPVRHLVYTVANRDGQFVLLEIGK